MPPTTSQRRRPSEACASRASRTPSASATASGADVECGSTKELLPVPNAATAASAAARPPPSGPASRRPSRYVSARITATMAKPTASVGPMPAPAIEYTPPSSSGAAGP